MKEMYVFAGPNGSGKSTVVNSFIKHNKCPKNFICPDNYVKTEDKDKYEPYIKAMQKAEAVRYQEVALGHSFSFETVLSTPEKLDFIRYAKRQGYSVFTIYVSTESPEINIERVKERVLHGGHDVPRDKIISRYEKSMELMYDVACESDVTEFFDNSGEKHIYVGVLSVAWIMAADLEKTPKWFDKYVISKGRQNGKLIDDLSKRENVN
jgi:predicted ABC-type ATPase